VVVAQVGKVPKIAEFRSIKYWLCVGRLFVRSLLFFCWKVFVYDNVRVKENETFEVAMRRVKRFCGKDRPD